MDPNVFVSFTQNQRQVSSLNTPEHSQEATTLVTLAYEFLSVTNRASLTVEFAQ